MFGKRIVIFILAINFVTSSIQADNSKKTLAEILGGSAAVAAIAAATTAAARAGILNDLIAKICSLALNISQALDGVLSSKYTSPTDPKFVADAQTYASNYVIQKNNLAADTEYNILVKDYPDDWAEGFINYMAPAFTENFDADTLEQFLGRWNTAVTGSSDEEDYDSVFEYLYEAVSVGGEQFAIGKWSVPEGYSNVVDYMIKNNITSPQALESLHNYMVAANEGSFPAKYTPGDVPPSIPNVPNESINVPNNISSGTGSGFSENYVNAYNSALSDFNSISKQMSLANYNNALIQNYKLIKQESATLKNDIAEEQAAGQDVSELQSQLESNQAKLAATEDAYKTANAGKVIPE